MLWQIATAAGLMLGIDATTSPPSRPESAPPSGSWAARIRNWSGRVAATSPDRPHRLIPGPAAARSHLNDRGSRTTRPLPRRHGQRRHIIRHSAGFAAIHARIILTHRYRHHTRLDPRPRQPLLPESSHPRDHHTPNPCSTAAPEHARAQRRAHHKLARPPPPAFRGHTISACAICSARCTQIVPQHDRPIRRRQRADRNPPSRSDFSAADTPPPAPPGPASLIHRTPLPDPRHTPIIAPARDPPQPGARALSPREHTMAEVRKKIKWPTKRRKGGSRQWKSKWVTVYKADEKSDRK